MLFYLLWFFLFTQYQLKNFMETTLGKIQNTGSALIVLKQFERYVIWGTKYTPNLKYNYKLNHNKKVWCINTYNIILGLVVCFNGWVSRGNNVSSLNICLFWILISLGIPNLGIDETYQHLLQNYAQDIEMVSRIFKEQRQDPPIGRNLPPVGGRILWAKQLYSKIHSPMALFQQVFKFLGSKKKI